MSRPKAKRRPAAREHCAAIIRAALPREPGPLSVAVYRRVLTMEPEEILRLVALQADLLAWALRGLEDETRETVNIEDFLRTVADPDAEIERREAAS